MLYLFPDKARAVSRRCSVGLHYVGQIVCRLTCLPPDWQILVLLDIQHDLQPVPHSALLGFSGGGLVTIEGVAFPISGVNLEENALVS